MMAKEAKWSMIQISDPSPPLSLTYSHATGTITTSCFQKSIQCWTPTRMQCIDQCSDFWNIPWTFHDNQFFRQFMEIVRPRSRPRTAAQASFQRSGETWRNSLEQNDNFFETLTSGSFGFDSYTDFAKKNLTNYMWFNEERALYLIDITHGTSPENAEKFEMKFIASFQSLNLQKH